MRFVLLGPIRAWRGEVEADLGPPTRRAVLAVLLAHAGTPVPLDRIIDILWADDPPDSAANIVHRHIGHLRRLVSPEQALTGGAGGYLLPVDAETLDLVRFRECGAAATAATDQGAAWDHLAEALALCQGPTVAGVPARVRTHPVFTAIDQERLAVLRRAADTALAAGHPDRVLRALTAAGAEHPLDEAVQAGLVRVLAATGRQAEALSTYQAVRARLADELGVDPGPDLRAAHAQVLDQTVPTPTPVAARPAFGPAQLPTDLPTFTGRAVELARIRELAAGEGIGVLITVISGMAGVGKSTLAVRAAHTLAARFPDGQLYLDLRGFDRTGAVVSTGEAIRTLLETLGVPPSDIPVGTDAQTARYRALLAGRRAVVVLDNAGDAEQVRPLLPGSPGCLVLVTSRDRLRGLVATHGAQSITLAVPGPADARESLRRRLGAARVAAEPGAVGEILDRCGRLPLALAVVAARAATHPGFSLATIAAELRRSAGSLDAFTDTDPVADARAVFSWSYRVLSPQAARLFRLLPGHPGTAASVAAVASLAGVGPGAARTLLRELGDNHLVEESAPDSHTCHDLLRAYAAELAATHDPAAALADARRRLDDHYLHSAEAAATTLHPYRERLLPSTEPADGVVLADVADHDAAESWLREQRAVLVAIVERAAHEGSGDHGWRLARALELFLDRLGSRQDQLTVHRAALAIADRLGEPLRLADAHRAVGFALLRVDRHDEAGHHLDQALRRFGDLGHHAGRARTRRALAFQANILGDHAAALAHYDHALADYDATASSAGRARVLNEIGWTDVLLGDHARALTRCRESLGLHRRTGDRNGEAAALDSLGYAYHHLGRHERAIDCYRRAAHIYREISDRFLEADTLAHLGDSQDASGDRDAAGMAWQEALRLLEMLRHPGTERLRDKLDRLRVVARRA
ncbi:AfsR/SARP family transcriptional regulator [Actinokineospora enzanensis]|uniref:AfsR/SARP family transcriptional regulator n=1 Tax=Actinokineospora enzanensis TaxID=155975 RepID=UPI0003736830|nr:BTAD domain-containing putative transcriptional regulator [Actinokineospora enzanensis]